MQSISKHFNLTNPAVAAIVATILLWSTTHFFSRLHAAEKPLSDELKSILVEKPVNVAPFKLHDQFNKAFTEKSLENKWTFVFFGYTNCPDVCPTTMAELDNAAARLEKTEKNSKEIQYLFVSIDPERDTSEHLAEYVSYFSTKFIAATGDEEELKKFATPLRIGFRVGFKTESTYFMDHGASMLLIDPQGRYVARLRPPHYSENIVTAFKNIVAYQGDS